ncbi:MAG: hypothetical protein AABW73_00280 [Nanoarchaeota archaeon]
MVYISPLIKTCIIFLFMATSPLVGVILSRVTKEELFIGRKYFVGVLWTLIILTLFFVDLWFFGFLSGLNALVIVLTCAYFFVIVSISLFMSYKRS